jgi:hypothetical protein
VACPDVRLMYGALDRNSAVRWKSLEIINETNHLLPEKLKTRTPSLSFNIEDAIAVYVFAKSGKKAINFTPMKNSYKSYYVVFNNYS